MVTKHRPQVYQFLLSAYILLLSVLWMLPNSVALDGKRCHLVWFYIHFFYSDLGRHTFKGWAFLLAFVPVRFYASICLFLKFFVVHTVAAEMVPPPAHGCSFPAHPFFAPCSYRHFQVVKLISHSCIASELRVSIRKACWRLDFNTAGSQYLLVLTWLLSCEYESLHPGVWTHPALLVPLAATPAVKPIFPH